MHELNHNLRYSPGNVVWNPASVTVGERAVSEGLADAFARQLYGDELGYARVGVPHLRDDKVSHHHRESRLASHRNAGFNQMAETCISV